MAAGLAYGDLYCNFVDFMLDDFMMMTSSGKIKFLIFALIDFVSFSRSKSRLS